MTVKPVSKLSRTIVGVALAVTGTGPLLADFVVPRTAEQHLHNSNWPPHAKFHDAQYIVMGMLTGGIGLRILLGRGGNQRARFQAAAALGATPWLGMFGALAFPGTAATDPEFEATEPKVLGMHPQLFMAAVLLAGLTGAVTVEGARSRGARQPGTRRRG